MKVTLRTDVSGAGTTSATFTLANIEAYDRINVTAPASDSVEVEVQPGGSGQVQLIFITAGTYSDNLTYTVTGGEADVALNAPHIFVGSGAVALLGSTQNTITFTNGETSDIDVEILVGRDATPPSP
jgi:hypothetical protein